MARHKVIVKHLAAIQNFGSMDVLCSDKTGTLTSGDTALDQHLDPFGKAAERVFLLAYLNSFYETGVETPANAALRKAGGEPARQCDSQTRSPGRETVQQAGRDSVRLRAAAGNQLLSKPMASA